MIINKISLKYRGCEAVLTHYDNIFSQAEIKIVDKTKRILCALKGITDEIYVQPNGDVYVAVFVHQGELVVGYLPFFMRYYEGEEERLVKKVIDYLLKKECDLNEN